jgi:acetolactate synthase small subunit
MKDEQRMICVSTEDKCGVLVRVAGIITAKGANIHRVTACADQTRPGRSIILIVATVEPRLQERVLKEINRLVNVFWALDVTPTEARVVSDDGKVPTSFCAIRTGEERIGKTSFGHGLLNE